MLVTVINIKVLEETMMDDNNQIQGNDANNSLKEKARKDCEKLNKARKILLIIAGVLFVLVIVIQVILAIALGPLIGLAVDVVVFFIFLAIEIPLVIIAIILGIIIAIKSHKNGLIVRRKDMNYRSLESLERIEKLCEETDVALNTKHKKVKGVSVILGAIIVVGVLILCMMIAYLLLINLGTAGLSAVGITSALAALGGSMVGGIFVIGLIIAVPPILAGAIYFTIRELKFKSEKDFLYKEALKKQQAVVKALQEEVNADSERINYLNELNVLLKRTIKELNEDRGNDESES